MENKVIIPLKKSLAEFNEDHDRVKKVIDEFVYKHIKIMAGTNTRVRPGHAFMLDFVFDGEIMNELYE